MRCLHRSETWLVWCGLVVSACGAENLAAPSADGPWGNFDDGADSAVHEADGGGAGSDAGSGNVPTQPGSGAGDGDLTDENACGATSLAAEEILVEHEVEVEVEVEVPAPVALYVMFDRSLSMASKLWTPATQALKGFFADSKSEGIDVALQFFPSSGGACNGNGYKTPAVALGRLPGHASALTTSLDKQSASGIGTPVEGALRGITEYCKTFQKNNPNERCIGVLVTDGEPEWDSCEKGDAKLTAIAADAYNNHQVRTFAVGLSGANFTLLDKIAKAGGAADCDPSASRFACDVSAGAEKLSEALAKIRDTVTTVEVRTEIETRTETRPLECEWQMPDPSVGQEVDTNRVNVKVSGGAGDALTLGRVPSESACQDGAWRYDSADQPTRIIACPETCSTIKNAGHTDVKILLGCETKLVVF